MTDTAFTPALHSIAPVNHTLVDVPAPVFPVQTEVYANEYVASLDNGRFLAAEGRETVTDLGSAQVFRKRSALASAVRTYRRSATQLGFEPSDVSVLHRQKLVTQFVSYAGEIHLDGH